MKTSSTPASSSQMAFLRLLILLMASAGPVPVAAQAVPGTDPAAKITVECRLVEMTSAQADAVLATIVRWSANPAIQGRQLLKLLWGDGVKKSLEVQTETLPAQRALATANTAPQISWVPVGGDPAKWKGDLVTPGERLELEAYPLPGQMANAVRLLLAYHSTRLEGARLTKADCANQFNGFNGIPMIFGRYDAGGVARLIVGRASWFDPGASEQLLGSPISQLYVSTRLLAIPRHLEAEAARRFAEPATFIPWLKTQCPVPFMQGMSSSSSGQAMRVNFSTEERRKVDFHLQTHFISGLKQEVDAVLGKDRRTLNMNIKIAGRLTASEAGATWSAVAGRSLQTPKGAHVQVELDGSAVVRMSEWLPSDAQQTEAKLVETPDVFLLIEPVWPGRK